MKFRRGDKVCALLVANKWGIDFTAFMGKLVSVEQTEYVKKATIRVTHYYSLYSMDKHQPKEFTLDIRLFKLLKWNSTTKKKVGDLRTACRMLDQMTKNVKNL
jgi:hypothetical protein